MKLYSYYYRLVNLLCIFLFVYITIPKYISFGIGPIELSADRVVFIFLLLFYIFGLLSFSSVQRLLLQRISNFKNITFLFVFFFIIQGLSVYFSSQPDYSLKRYIYFFLYNFFIYFITFSIPLDHKHLKKIAVTLIVASSFVIFFAFLEIINNSNPFIPFLNAEGLNEYQKQILEDKLRGGTRRVQSSFSNPLGFGQYVVLVIPILLYFKNTILKKGYLVNFLVLCLGFTALMTKSRALLLILVLCFCYYFFSFIITKENRLGKKIIILLSFSLLLLFAFSVFDFSFIAEFLGGKEILSDSNRAEQLAMAVPLISNSMLSGFGFGMGAEVLGFGAIDGYGTIDNYLLTILLDSGIIALIIYFIFISKITIKFFMLKSNVKIGWIGLVFFIMNLFTLSITEIHPLFYFFLAILLIRNQENEGFYSNYSG